MLTNQTEKEWFCLLRWRLPSQDSSLGLRLSVAVGWQLFQKQLSAPLELVGVTVSSAHPLSHSPATPGKQSLLQAVPTCQRLIDPATGATQDVGTAKTDNRSVSRGRALNMSFKMQRCLLLGLGMLQHQTEQSRGQHTPGFHGFAGCLPPSQFTGTVPLSVEAPRACGVLTPCQCQARRELESVCRFCRAPKSVIWRKATHPFTGVCLHWGSRC